MASSPLKYVAGLQRLRWSAGIFVIVFTLHTHTHTQEQLYGQHLHAGRAERAGTAEGHSSAIGAELRRLDFRKTDGGGAPPCNRTAMV